MKSKRNLNSTIKVCGNGIAFDPNVLIKTLNTKFPCLTCGESRFERGLRESVQNFRDNQRKGGPQFRED